MSQKGRDVDLAKKHTRRVKIISPADMTIYISSGI